MHAQPPPPWVAARQHALLLTADVAGHLFAGRVPPAHYHVATPFPPAYAAEERVWAASPFRLQEFGAVGDGTYESRTTIFGGTGALGLLMLAGTAGASAIGNHRRRAAAEAAATPRWHDIDGGTLAVSGWGFYLDTVRGLFPWNWGEIAQADVVAPGVTEFAGASDRGRVKWRLVADLAELVFAVWALRRYPRHPQLTSGSWFPGGWRGPGAPAELRSDPPRPQLPAAGPMGDVGAGPEPSGWSDR